MTRSEYFKAYYEANKERVKAQVAAYRAANPEKARAAVDKWHKDPVNAERRREYAREVVAKSEAFRRAQAKYLSKNPGAKQAKCVKRRCAKANRTPSWLTADDCDIINSMYRLAGIYRESTGVRYEVDHIIPLQGKTVSGLHVPGNLQIIEMRENRVKSNKHG